MYRQSVSGGNAVNRADSSADRESNADLPAALRKAKANAKASISESDQETPAATATATATSSHHPPPPPPLTSAGHLTSPRSASPPPKPATSHPPLSSSSSSSSSSTPPDSPHHDAASSSSSSTEIGTSTVPAGPVYKTIMVNGPNGEKREMKIIAINPGKPLLTSEAISSKPTGGYGGSKGWVDDDETVKCMRCPNEFSVANRRHHCRACGFVVCGTCSNHTEVLNGSDERYRVCFHCFFEIAKTGKRPNPIDRPGEPGGLGDMFAFSKKEH